LVLAVVRGQEEERRRGAYRIKRFSTLEREGPHPTDRSKEGERESWLAVLAA